MNNCPFAPLRILFEFNYSSEDHHPSKRVQIEKWKFFKVSLFGFLINVQLNLRFSFEEFFESLGRFIV